MIHHLIEGIQVGISKSGHTAQPANCYAVAEVAIRKGNRTHYYSLQCADEQFRFYRSDRSTYQIQVDEDREHWDEVAMGYIGSIDADRKQHISFDDGDNPIWGFLVTLLCVPWNIMEQMKSECSGKYLEDIRLPLIEDSDELA